MTNKFLSRPIDIKKGIAEIDKRWQSKKYKLYWTLRYGIIEWIKDTKFDIKARWQRFLRGWAYSDTWSLDYYLGRVISESVEYLQTHHNGHPSSLTEKSWNIILSKISKAFKLAQDISNGDRMLLLPNITKEQEKDFNCVTKEEYKAMNEGMRLFVKYYFHLWD